MVSSSTMRTPSGIGAAGTKRDRVDIAPAPTELSSTYGLFGLASHLARPSWCQAAGTLPYIARTPYIQLHKVTKLGLDPAAPGALATFTSTTAAGSVAEPTAKCPCFNLMPVPTFYFYSVCILSGLFVALRGWLRRNKSGWICYQARERPLAEYRACCILVGRSTSRRARRGVTVVSLVVFQAPPATFQWDVHSHVEEIRAVNRVSSLCSRGRLGDVG